MKKTVFLLLLLVFSTGAAFSQKVYDLMELKMDSIVVKEHRASRLPEVTVGTRVSSISSIVLMGNQTKSLSELLSDNTMVYIKSLGQGALATSSFRGTSSSHTQVNWNGISINPSMSSSFDFSQIPVFFADHVTLYHGNSHLKNGTGALGGSINITNTPDWVDSTRLRVFGEWGANDTYTAAASVRFFGKRSLYQTRVYYQQSDNDYRYLNKVHKLEDFYERRKEAQYKQAGVMQEAYFRLSDYGTLSSNLWFQYGNRRLPQPIIVNVTQHEKQEESALKYFLGYDYSRDKHEFSVKGAYLLSILEYDKWFDSDYFPGDASLNRSQSLHAKGDYRYLCSPKFNVSGSVMYTHDFVKATSYSKGTVGRDVLALQGSALWNATEWLTANAQVMGELNDTKLAPTFSAGFSAQLIEGLLTGKGNVSYNYKFPSLNDLYWQPGGNPNLKPEQGFSYDATLCYTPKFSESLYFKAEATYYLMNIDNWIMWLPTMNWYWEPRNVQNVLSHGLELSTELNYVTSTLRAKLSVNYSYSPSINRQHNFEEDNSYKKQLPYIPLQKGNARLSVDYKRLFFSYQIYHTGKRYVSADESYSTNAYTVHDAEAGYNFVLKSRYKLTPKLRANNLFDAYYESTQYYPMPLRSLSLSLSLTF